MVWGRSTFSGQSPWHTTWPRPSDLSGAVVVIREGTVCAAGNSVRGLKTIKCIAGELGVGLFGPATGE